MYYRYVHGTIATKQDISIFTEPSRRYWSVFHICRDMYFQTCSVENVKRVLPVPTMKPHKRKKNWNYRPILCELFSQRNSATWFDEQLPRKLHIEDERKTKLAAVRETDLRDCGTNGGTVVEPLLEKCLDLRKVLLLSLIVVEVIVVRCIAQN